MMTILAMFGVMLFAGFVLVLFAINPAITTLAVLVILVVMFFPVQVAVILGIIIAGIVCAYLVSDL